MYSPLYRNVDELTASLVLAIMIAFYASLLLLKYMLELAWPSRENIHAFYYTAATLLTLVFMNSSSPDFIYFQF